MFKRNLGHIIQKDSLTVPAVVLYGSLQVGKTTVIKQLAEANAAIKLSSAPQLTPAIPKPWPISYPVNAP